MVMVVVVREILTTSAPLYYATEYKYKYLYSTLVYSAPPNSPAD